MSNLKVFINEEPFISESLLINSLAQLYYRKNDWKLPVALLCDDFLDPSGKLLGHVREKAIKLSEKKEYLMIDKETTIVSFSMIANPFTLFTKEMANNMLGQKTKFRDFKGDHHPAEIIKAEIIKAGREINIMLKVEDPNHIIRRTIEYEGYDHLHFVKKEN